MIYTDGNFNLSACVFVSMRGLSYIIITPEGPVQFTLVMCMYFTLTAAWCWLSVCSGATWLWLSVESQSCSRLSLAPLARKRPSGDHAKPHTSCVWPARVPTWWLGSRTSWWWMAPERLPLKGKGTITVQVRCYFTAIIIQAQVLLQCYGISGEGAIIVWVKMLL